MVVLWEKPSKYPPKFSNGVMDALSELGITQLKTPLTPQKLWQAIRDAKATDLEIPGSR